MGVSKSGTLVGEASETHVRLKAEINLYDLKIILHELNIVKNE